MSEPLLELFAFAFAGTTLLDAALLLGFGVVFDDAGADADGGVDGVVLRGGGVAFDDAAEDDDGAAGGVDGTVLRGVRVALEGAAGDDGAVAGGVDGADDAEGGAPFDFDVAVSSVWRVLST